MKIIINRKAFADALNTCVGFIAKKNVLEVFNNIKFVTKGNDIRLQAGNSDRYVRKYVTAESIDQDGSFMTDCTTLTNFVAKLSGDTIELTLDGNTLTITHDDGKAKFSALNGDEYPEDNIANETPTQYTIPTEFIAEAIAKGKDFTGKDELRPVMQAIYCYIKDGIFGFCATDTRVLIHGERPFADNAATEDVDFFIMPEAALPILKSCRGSEYIIVSIYERNVAYRIGDTIIVTSLFKGNFPDFRRIIAMKPQHSCVFDKKRMITAIDRVSLLTDNNQMVKFGISPTRIELVGENFERMSKGSEQIECKADIEITAGFNGDYFAQCLNVFNDGDVTVLVANPSRPAFFLSDNNPTLVAMQMPMSLPNAQ